MHERRALPRAAVVGPADRADAALQVELARIAAERAVGRAAQAQVEGGEELAGGALVAGRLQKVGVEALRLGEAAFGEEAAQLGQVRREVGHLAAAGPVVERLVVERDALVGRAPVDEGAEAAVAEGRRLAPVARGEGLEEGLFH